MKKKIYFIVNPISGIGRQKIIEKLIDESLNRLVFDYEIAYTKAAKHATELARNAAAKGFDIVVAVGGDGSVNEVARGLIGTQTAMAVIPTGSGNGMARHLNISLNLKKAIAIINAAKETTVDTMLFNDQPFVNVAGVGFDAHIVWEFAKFGKRGFSSYIKLVLREFPRYKAGNYELTVDGKTLPKTAFLISFANGSQWGNNAYIAPAATMDDGYMDIAILKEFSLLSTIAIGYRLFRKTLPDSSYLEIIRCKEAFLKQSNTVAHIDGEPLEIGNEISIIVKPLSLKVIVP